MVKVISALLLLFGLSFKAFSQLNDLEAKGSGYHSFFLEGGINSQIEENCPIWSADGKSLWLVRNDALKTQGFDIYLTHWVNDSLFTTPKKLGKPLNNAGDNAVMAVTDSQGLFLLNSYLGSREMLPGLSFVNKDSLGWTRPIPLQISDFNPDSKAAIGYFKWGKKLLISYRDSLSKHHHIYWSHSLHERDSVWSAPQKIEGWPNFKGSSFSPSLSVDGKRLYFSTGDLPNFGGVDIYFCERLDEQGLQWSEPKNLGSKVNTSGFDAYWAQSPFRKCAVFVSDGGRLSSQTDLFGVDTSICKWALTLAQVDELVKVKANFASSKPSSEEKTIEGENLSEVEEAFPTDLSAYQERFRWSVYFGFDSDSIIKKFERKIKDAIQEWERDTLQLILIEGHTDSIGSRAYALNLSERRAKSVLKKLNAAGIGPTKTAIEAHGMRYPKRGGNSEKDRAQNRRADLILLRKMY